MTIPARDTVADMFRRAEAAKLPKVDKAIGFYLQYFCVNEETFLSELYAKGLETELAGNLDLQTALKIYLPNSKN